MKSKLGICLVVIAAGGICWWLYPTASSDNTSSAVNNNARRIDWNVPAATMSQDVEHPLSLPERLEQAKKASFECWQQEQQNLQERQSRYDNPLNHALMTALANGESYEQLLMRVPEGRLSGYYVLQLNIAQRQLQLQQMGFEPSEQQLEQRRQEPSFDRWSLAEHITMLSEANAAKQFYELRDGLSQLTSLDQEQFAQQASGYQLTSGDLTTLMLQDYTTFSQEQLLTLLEQTPTQVLNQKPLVINMATNVPMMNIADYAAYALNVPVLKALAERGIYPTELKGYFGPIENALNHPSWGNSDNEQMSTMLQYLVDQGYKAYTVNTEAGVQLGSPLFPESGSDHQAAKQFLQRANALTPSMALTGSATGAVDRALNDIAAAREKRNEHFRTCQALQMDLSQIEQLLNGRQIDMKINELAKQFSGDALLEALQTEDPALVDIYLDSRSAGRPTHQQAFRDAMLEDDPVVGLGELLQTTELTADDIDVMLLNLINFPTLVPYWNNRQTLSAPSSLSILKHLNADQMTLLIEQGFDLHITDQYQRNLYGVLFSSQPQFIEQLEQARVDPFSNDYGADALDMALDRSYLDNTLFAGTLQILQACVSLEPNHQRRLARLKLYRPQLYQQLLAMDPRVVINDGVQPNVVLSVQ
ncbi:hypothetical protein L9G74_04475 [Shewanella sp. C32]|uniref:Uncharacterized protein n=1 Tax=Shewanella electrica TaxID=515560 RepID=A0ABT2FHF7_9GAMM|nr:hypothetical protein [Shewanella electrica]MCH1923587.1 hypothetical protein [Shewanella electrica]MCS4555683.1 hypothetical protein [Shewanella electrica]